MNIGYTHPCGGTLLISSCHAITARHTPNHTLWAMNARFWHEILFILGNDVTVVLRAQERASTIDLCNSVASVACRLSSVSLQRYVLWLNGAS